MAGKLVLKALRRVWLTLESAQCPRALMGGLALSLWKHVRNTQDVDLLIGLGGTSIEALLDQLRRAGVRTKHHPPVLDLGSVRIIQLLYEPPDTFMDIQIDLLLAESDFHRQALARRIPAALPDLDIDLSTLSCEDLLLLKLNADRIIDRADAARLLRLNRNGLDFGYLLKWVTQLGLAREWSEIWNEAFPGEEPPDDRAIDESP
jgi:hypothetical protein